MGMERKWPLTSVRSADAGPAQAAMEIVCGWCGKADHLVNTGGEKVLPPDVTRKKFERRGWQVGSRPAADRCPECLAALNARKGGAASRLTLISKETDVATMAAAEPAGETPRAPTREQRRIIFLKLEEVYLDEARGYERGWSDKRVAEDLGVPRAWVVEIRDQNFGPTRDNEDVRELLAMHQQLVAEAGALKAESEALVRRCADLDLRLAAVAKTADAIRRAVS